MKRISLGLRRRLLVLALASGAAWGGGASAEVIAVDLVVVGGKRVSGPNLIKLKRDDVLVLTVVSDRADNLHIHGYDLQLDLHAGRPASLRFTARRTGRFGFELHRSGQELGVLEIYPK